ncbi:hypothetical protein B0F90DRAFT_1809723 [Multifurca ochricompacta]|uniref:Uncharacterized protein n=1 Tax=Multifurca ochricompacta TaxID=376703 RepID=A0AAD4M8H6_9AGAM|nr:hypothetical protein B0F90DRAFT_1809723 [Multifurca ochricompacta]
MPSLLSPVISFYDYALRPVPALAWLGAPAARSWSQNKGQGKSSGKSGRAAANELPEPRSRVRDYFATLVMVHGGEAIAAPWLGLRPSFFMSSTYPAFFGAHTLVDILPTVPSPSIFTEIPLTILHALFLVTGHASPAVATSSYTLLLTAFIIPNGGPFLANLFSLLRPTPIEVTTPPELLPSGWTATDLWAAPLVTGLYATLTHGQPFFTHIHTLFFAFFSPLGLAHLSEATKGDGSFGQDVAPLDVKTARAACAIVLSVLYVNRAIQSNCAYHECYNRT